MCKYTVSIGLLGFFCLLGFFLIHVYTYSLCVYVCMYNVKNPLGQFW